MTELPTDLPPLHADLTFLSPLSAGRAAGLVEWLGEGVRDGGTVLDVGCGWAELLLSVSEAAPRATCVGVDTDVAALAHGRRRSTARGLSQRVTLLAGPGSTTGPTDVDALICIGATHVWGSGTADDGPLPYAAALDGIRQRVRRGARVVYADGIWSRPPTPAATAPLGGRDDEFLPLSELCALAVEAGFAVVSSGEATQEEWDDFESGFTARYAAWLASHAPDDPLAAAVREAAAAQRASYLDGYRGALGMAYLRLVAV